MLGDLAKDLDGEGCRLQERTKGLESERTFDMPIRATHQQLLALRDAVLTISADLSLPETLKRIVSTAARLAGARYAALGVRDEAGERLSEFVTQGVDPEVEASIQDWPSGHGLLGTMLHEGRSLRLRDLTQDPRASGFPPNHPRMTSFLGVPILHHGQLLGDLYLANKIGAREFSEADEAVIELLAAHAAYAILNARAYQKTVDHELALERRNRELTALNALITATSASLSLQHVLDEALAQAITVYGAEAADIYLVEDGTGDLILASHRGPVPEPFLAVRHIESGQGIVGKVASSGFPYVVRDLDGDLSFLRQGVVSAGFIAMACLPLRAKERIVGTLDIFSRDPGHFDDLNLSLLMSICNQIGIAVENARLHEQVAQLAVMRERQRIGMDLHDGVIQSIYAAGLTLELALGQMADGEMPAAESQVRRAIESLNTSIRDIRAYLLALRPRQFEGIDLVAGMERLLADYRVNTQMTVTFDADRSVQTELRAEEQGALFYIAQEALSNAARHSRATRIDVCLRADDDWIVFSLRDNGCGLPKASKDHSGGHGMRNMRERARVLGGETQITSPPGQGTEVRVLLPRRRGEHTKVTAVA